MLVPGIQTDYAVFIVLLQIDDGLNGSGKP